MGLGLWRLYSERKHAEALLMVDSEDLAGNGRALGWAATELYINLCKTLGQTDSARKTKDAHKKKKRKEVCLRFQFHMVAPLTLTLGNKKTNDGSIEMPLK